MSPPAGFYTARRAKMLREARNAMFRRAILAAAGIGAMVALFSCSGAHAQECDKYCGLRATAPKLERHRERHVFDTNGNRTVIGGRPVGCPHAYCGCGLRKYLGLDDTRLNLAANWARLFPRTTPHPGAAAVRAHHVMLLVSHVGGSRWVVRDYNGGRHLSWIHERDTRGYVFVEPRSRMAANPRAGRL